MKGLSETSEKHPDSLQLTKLNEKGTNFWEGSPQAKISPLSSPYNLGYSSEVSLAYLYHIYTQISPKSTFYHTTHKNDFLNIPFQEGYGIMVLNTNNNFGESEGRYHPIRVRGGDMVSLVLGEHFERIEFAFFIIFFILFFFSIPPNFFLLAHFVDLGS